MIVRLNKPWKIVRTGTPKVPDEMRLVIRSCKEGKELPVLFTASHSFRGTNSVPSGVTRSSI
jgi:hypothetical protein